MADETPAPPETGGQPSASPETGGQPAPEPMGTNQRSKLGGSDDGLKADLTAERRKRHDLEARLKELEPLATKALELEDAQKTVAEKLQAKLTAAETDGADAKSALLRLEVALDKAPAGMEPAKIRSLAGRLRGKNREELEADATELFADFGGGKPADTEGDPPAPNGGQPPAPRPDPAQGSRGTPPPARPTSLGQAVGAALRPKT